MKLLLGKNAGPKWFAANRTLVGALFCLLVTFSACKQEAPVNSRIKRLDSVQTRQLVQTIEGLVKPELSDNLSLNLWGVDSLVVSPIAIDIDDRGRVYYATTNRARNSEFDIRGHPDWEIPSIQLQSIEDKRAFLRKELSPENSKRNTWLKRGRALPQCLFLSINHIPNDPIIQRSL